MIRQAELADWLEDRVTISFLEIITGLIKLEQDSLTDLIMSSNSLKDIEGKIQQGKGRIEMLELVNNIELFMNERIEDEEVYTTRTECDSPD